MVTQQRRLLRTTRLPADSVLTDTEQEWARIAINDAAEGARGIHPPHLDIKSISALRAAEGLEDETACLNRSWIKLRCVHGNSTGRSTRCRWCDGCVNAWRSRVRAIILEGCDAQETYFWTLTLAESPSEMDLERFDFITLRWRRMMRVMQKEGYKFEYFRVIELQRRGTPHYHLAMNRITYRGVPVLGVGKVGGMCYSRAVKAGFGRIMDLQKARLGGAGVASYLAKYIGKADEYRALVRTDGRAVRRYARSQGWVGPKTAPVWRYAAVRRSYSAEPLSEVEVPCACGDHETLSQAEQADQWMKANRKAGSWIAPLSVLDYIMEKEIA